MITKKEVALKILQVGKAGFTTQEDGYKKLDECIDLIDKYVSEQLNLRRVNSTFKVRLEKEIEELEKRYKRIKDDTEYSFTDVSNWSKELNIVEGEIKALRKALNYC